MRKVIFLFVVLFCFMVSCGRKGDTYIASFKHENYVTNATKYECDTMIKFVLSDVYGYSNIHVVVSSFNFNNSNGEYTLHAYINKNPYIPNTYNIGVYKNLSKSEARQAIIHELVHLKQYEDSLLIQTSETEVIYKGQLIKLKRVPYEKRPYERDAFKDAHTLHKHLRDYNL